MSKKDTTAGEVGSYVKIQMTSHRSICGEVTAADEYWLTLDEETRVNLENVESIAHCERPAEADAE